MFLPLPSSSFFYRYIKHDLNKICSMAYGFGPKQTDLTCKSAQGLCSFCKPDRAAHKFLPCQRTEAMQRPRPGLTDVKFQVAKKPSLLSRKRLGQRADSVLASTSCCQDFSLRLPGFLLPFKTGCSFIFLQYVLILKPPFMEFIEPLPPSLAGDSWQVKNNTLFLKYIKLYPELLKSAMKFS